MDRQEVFNKVWAGLVEQRSPGWDFDTLQCTYRDEQGFKCAVGLLLPEEGPWWNEVGGVANLLTNYPELNGLLSIEPPDDVVFLTMLQNAHDEAAEVASYDENFGEFIDELAPKFQEIANRYGLKFPGRIYG